MKRSRGRGRRQQNPVNRSYDSNGPDVRVRGTASQVYEKYQALARDAMSAGDRVMAENYSQHGEHYYRIMLSLQPPPSEVDKETAGDGEGHGDAVEAALETSVGNGGEPLVLVRDSEDGDDKPTKPSSNSSSNPSRRRGPLRKKKAASDEVSDDSAHETANGDVGAEAVIVESQAGDESAEAAPASE